MHAAHGDSFVTDRTLTGGFVLPHTTPVIVARGVYLGHRWFVPVAIFLTKGAQDVDNFFDGFNGDQQTALAAQIKDLKRRPASGRNGRSR
jgi:hypothetical protein